MIWFYLAGWISGAATVVMILRLWAFKHGTVIRVTEEEMDRVDEEMSKLMKEEDRNERD